jgi:hypothetical protein
MCLDEAMKPGWRRPAIVVREGEQRSFGLLSPRIPGGGGTPIGLTYEGQGESLSKRSHRLVDRIRTAVVDDDDFPSIRRIFQFRDGV